MLLTVRELCDRVEGELPALVEELAEITGRGGESERYAWTRSLPKLADVLKGQALANVHVHFERREHHAALEYQLPGSASWCDVVLLGRHGTRPSAVVIELKDWETKLDRPGKAEGLIDRHGIQGKRPSEAACSEAIRALSMCPPTTEVDTYVRARDRYRSQPGQWSEARRALRL